MLLNRERIGFWAKVMAIMLAVIFGVGTIFLGVGTSVPNLSEFFKGGESSSAQEQEKTLKERAASDPANREAALALADFYRQTGRPSEEASALIPLYEKTGSPDIGSRLGQLYVEKLNNPGQGVEVLTQVTQRDPKAATAFLWLGQGQEKQGNIQGAILAWNRYLELEPESRLAGTIKNKITSLSATTPQAGGGPQQPGTPQPQPPAQETP